MLNAAGLDVAGRNNPKWKGGLVAKDCVTCGGQFLVKPCRSESAKFCSMKCVGASQRKLVREWSMEMKLCEECATSFAVPASHAHRHFCCSRSCQGRRRSRLQSGEGNPAWSGGTSRLPYPYDWSKTSKRVIERDGFRCHGLECSHRDSRLTVHHIDYDKGNCAELNLITVCSSCNTKANFGRESWMRRYQKFMATFIGVQKDKVAGWKFEAFTREVA